MDYPGILLRPIALLRKEQVWMAEGGDLAIYNANKSIIQSLLEHSGIPESEHKLWIGIYRIGTRQDQARPAIVVSCLDPKVRKQAKGSIKSCSLFRQGGAFAHFTVLGKATPPELPCEPQLTMASNSQEHGLGFTVSSLPHQPEEHTNQSPEGDIQETTEGQIVLQVFGSHTGDNYLCRPIQARRGLQRQSATAGPLILLDETTYQLTVEHVVNFGRHKREPTWEHTNDDWDDDDNSDDDEDDGGYDAWGFEGMTSDFATIRTLSEGSLSSEDVEIDSSRSSSSSSGQELKGNTAWSPVEPASTSRPRSLSEPRTTGHIAVKDCSSSPQIELTSIPTRCHISEKLDYLLFPIHTSPDLELCTTRGAEMVQVSDVFDVHGQTTARPVIIATASLGYVRGIVFPASTLLQKPGSRCFQTLFCIESASPMPKGTSGSAVFDAQTGLLAGYLVLGCPGKCTCYMVPMRDVLAELNTLSSSPFQCQVQLDVSAIAEVHPEKSAITRFGLHAGSRSRSVPLPSIAPREETITHNNQPILGHSPANLPGVYPNLTHHVEKDLKAKKSPLNPRKFRPFKRYIDWFTSATLEWVSQFDDEWEKRFGRNINRPSGAVENRPFIDMIREITDMPELSEIQTFFWACTGTARLERATSHVERFCEGASFALDVFIAGDAENPTIKDIQEPRAWVSDHSEPEGFSNYPRVLGCKELYQVLQKKRFPESPHEDTVGNCRRIYIHNPNGSSVLALIRTASASQVEGFRQLFTNHITTAPQPKINLRESNWWRGCFIFSFNLPFFGIQYEDLGNISSNGQRPFRCCRNLSFLNPRNDDSTSPYPAFLHEAVWSFMVTGKSDHYWTAVFFDENPFDEEPGLPVDEETLGYLDPIILQHEWGITTASPRSYALAALATALSQIVEHHTDILDWLKTSFNHHISAIRQDPPAKSSPEDIQAWMGKFRDVLERVTDSNSSLLLKLDHFLSEDVVLGIDALPRGRLWRSLQSDADASRSLLRIQQYRHEFRDIEIEFHQLLHQLLRRAEGETCNRPLEKENDLFRQRYAITAVQFAITLLLLKPFFQLKPEVLNSSTWTELLIIVMLITTVAGCTVLASGYDAMMCWKCVHYS